MNYRERIKKRREELGMSLQDVADKMKTTKQTIQRYENGEIKSIGIETLKKIAEALNCTPAYLMGWTDVVTVKLPEEHTAYVGVIKDAAESGLTPEELREIINLGKKLRGK